MGTHHCAGGAGMTDTPETDAACNAIYSQGMAHIPLVNFMEKLERERDEARERADTMFAKYVDILEQTRNERDEWKAKYIQQNKELNALAYWRDISECDCSNPLPNGGCLRCDLDKIFNATENQNE